MKPRTERKEARGNDRKERMREDMEKEISYVACALLLLSASVWDIRKRAVPSHFLHAVAAAAAVYRLVWAGEEWWLTITGALVGLLFLLIGKLTKEAIGYGDGWGILALGIFLGLWDVLSMLLITMLLLFLLSVAALCFRRMSRKVAIPLYPVLTAGYFLWYVCGRS